MRIRHIQLNESNDTTFELLDDDDQPIEGVSGFMRHLRARGSSPNTLSAYAYDLLHFTRFLKAHHLTYEAFAPTHAWSFLEYLKDVPSHAHAQRLGLVLCTTDQEGAATCLSPTTINRILAAVSSFYEYLILSGQITDKENPIQKVDDPALARASGRHRPFMGHASRQRPIRRAVRVKTVQRLPRPMNDDHVTTLLASLHLKRDRAMILLMPHAGLRPGEVLNLHLDDHPKGARTKSRTERVVDLLQAETLQAVSDYVMHERPTDVDSPYVFLIGGRGKRRGEPLSYSALVKLFERHCERLGIREPCMTPHALRHTHATRMWEAGMRELALQKRLGHASPESTRIYTQVPDAAVVAEYRHALGEEFTQ